MCFPTITGWISSPRHSPPRRFILRSHLSLLDLSYNLLADLRLSVESLTHLEQLRVLYLHGNPLSVCEGDRVCTTLILSSS